MPDDTSEKRKFAKLFVEFNRKLEAAQIQGFNWGKDIYADTDVGGDSESYITMHFGYTTYLTLLQRYKELPTGGGGGAGADVPFDIDTHITEISTDAIDADYMNSRFNKFYKLFLQENVDPAAMEQVLQNLHQSFAMLSRTEQKYANLFISDIQSGEVKLDPTMTFRDYISKYMRKAEDARIARTVRRLGCSEDLLKKLLERKVDVTNYKQFGYFDNLVESVNRSRAERFFVTVEKDKYKAYRLTMLITKYLKDFVISGGIDPYADIIDGGRNTVKKQEQETEMGITSQHGGGSGTDDVTPLRDNDERLTIRTTVSGGQLSQWYGSSKAVACLMDSGCFAHIEGKVCLDEPKYVECRTTGNMRLTAYAKEHEEECFLQFEMGDDGKLHYVKLPESVADKKFHYADHISDDILKQIGLVSEIATMMLEAICNMGFGDALRELMSKRICDYSVGLLRSITGVDNNTINSMRNGTSLTKVNVVSACLGLHLPFPVSKNMLDIASIILELYKGAESVRRENTYCHSLLSLRWASDYDDIYEDLKSEGLESLIKRPH